MKTFFHALPLPGPKADRLTRMRYRAHAQMTVLKNSRPKAYAGVSTDMDSLALVWRRTEAEWRTVDDLIYAVDRPW